MHYIQYNQYVMLDREIRYAGRELNPRHADFQSAALPTELPGPTGSRIRHRPRSIVNYSL